MAPVDELYPHTPQDPVVVLMNEHRLIEQVLGSLVTFGAVCDPTQPDARQRLGEYVLFFRDFADRHHHGKEEDQLFEAMGSSGFPTAEGPIAVMLHEHELGRAHTQALAAVAAGQGPLSEAEQHALAEHSSGYGNLLRAHIGKEDAILFPLSTRVLPGHAISALRASFQAFQVNADAEGAIARLVALGESLVRAYPPPEGFTDRSGGHAGCGL